MNNTEPFNPSKTLIKLSSKPDESKSEFALVFEKALKETSKEKQNNN